MWLLCKIYSEDLKHAFVSIVQLFYMQCDTIKISVPEAFINLVLVLSLERLKVPESKNVFLFQSILLTISCILTWNVAIFPVAVWLSNLPRETPVVSNQSLSDTCWCFLNLTLLLRLFQDDLLYWLLTLYFILLAIHIGTSTSWWCTSLVRITKYHRHHKRSNIAHSK